MPSSRDIILQAVKDALQKKSNLPDSPPKTDERIAKALADITPTAYKGLKEQFQRELEKVAGEFRICTDQRQLTKEISQELKNIAASKLAIAGDGLPSVIAKSLEKKNPKLSIINSSNIVFPKRKYGVAAATAALVEVSYAIADIGSLIVIQDNTASILPHFLPENIFVIIKPDQLLTNLYNLFERLSLEESKNMIFITGPSRTADIEKILILGAHGPRRLVVYMLEK